MNNKIKLFSGSTFYPSGGWDDFKGYFDDVKSAKDWINQNEPDASYRWAHLVQDDKIILYASGHHDYDRMEEWVWRNEE